LTNVKKLDRVIQHHIPHRNSKPLNHKTNEPRFIKYMKYNIFINQEALYRLAPSLDIIDGGILNFLIDFCRSDNQKLKRLEIKENGNSYRYTWVSLSIINSEMPMIPFGSKAFFSQRIKKIEKTKFIKTFRAPDRNLYIRLTEKIDLLAFMGKSSSSKEVFTEINTSKGGGVHVEKPIIDISNNKHNIISKTDKKTFSFEDILKEMFVDPKRHINIIAQYWKFKKIVADNREQYETFLKRELRAARDLNGFSDEQIMHVMEYLETNETFKWNLSSVIKYVGEDLGRIKPIKGN